jgi:hypothetical protein
MYIITDYTYRKARELGVDVRPSKIKNKKIDVFKNGKKLHSIGAIGYLDYPNFVLKYGKDYADEKRRLYYLRHKKDLSVVGSAGYYAAKLLW